MKNRVNKLKYTKPNLIRHGDLKKVTNNHGDDGVADVNWTGV